VGREKDQMAVQMQTKFGSRNQIERKLRYIQNIFKKELFIENDSSRIFNIHMISIG